MQQALHILRKDMRHLYREILLVWTLAAALVFLGPGWADFLLLANAFFLVGRLIHAEPIPGDRQFWTTRPYRWKSLAAAKIGFILLFVNLPVCLAQLAIVWMEGFPVAAELPGLLWSQVLLIFCLWLPAAALATLTGSTMPFTFVALGLLAVGFIGSQAGARFNAPWPSGMEWMRYTAAGAILAGAAVGVLYWQYKDRRTGRGRLLALGGIAAGVCAYALLPWPLAFQLQAWISTQPGEGSPVQAKLQVEGVYYLVMPQRGGRSTMMLHVPLTISGVPAGDEARLDVAAVTVQSRDGLTWKQNIFSMRSLTSPTGVSQAEAIFPMDPAFAAAADGQPVTIRTSMYLMLFGRAHEKTAAVQETPVNVANGLQCFRDRFGVVYCRSAFRWPGELVYARLSDTVLNPINTLISYAPFPAVLGLSPIETHWGSGPERSKPEVTLVMKRPVAYVRRDVEAQNVPLKKRLFPEGIGYR